MSESIEIPSPIMEKIMNLKIRSDKAPIDVISRGRTKKNYSSIQE
jgi:hypothetical protein